MVTFGNGYLEREWSDVTERVGRVCTRVIYSGYHEGG